MKLDYTVQVWKEGKQFIAHAMPIDVASSGPTPEAARQAVDEAVRLFLATAADHGTLEEVLNGSVLDIGKSSPFDRGRPRSTPCTDR